MRLLPFAVLLLPVTLAASEVTILDSSQSASVTSLTSGWGPYDDCTDDRVYPGAGDLLETLVCSAATGYGSIYGTAMSVVSMETSVSADTLDLAVTASVEVLGTEHAPFQTGGEGAATWELDHSFRTTATQLLTVSGTLFRGRVELFVDQGGQDVSVWVEEGSPGPVSIDRTDAIPKGEYRLRANVETDCSYSYFCSTFGEADLQATFTPPVAVGEAESESWARLKALHR